MYVTASSERKLSVWNNRRTILSTLWIFLVLNFIYADVFNLYFDPEAVKT